MKPKYNATFERDEDGWWVASVREIRGCHTQARSIKQTRERLREAMLLFVDDLRDGEVAEHVKLPKEARRIVGETLSARERADAAASTAQDRTRKAVRFLTKRLKLSVRDAGDLLGLSHQRVQQLLA